MADSAVPLISHLTELRRRLIVIVIAVVVGQVKKEVEDVKDSLDKGYATKADLAALSDRIKMLERIVYGAVGVILLTVLGALLTLVLRNGA